MVYYFVINSPKFYEVIYKRRENMSIIVNASNVNKREGLRMIDFLSGYCYACNGIYKKIDEMIYKFEIKR